MKDFEELIAWQKAVEVAKVTYLTTRKFPQEERYGLSSQMRRSSVSVSSNIAEGFGRYQAKDKKRFYHIALGSLLELKSQTYIAEAVDILDADSAVEVRTAITEDHKLLNALIASVKENP